MQGGRLQQSGAEALVHLSRFDQNHYGFIEIKQGLKVIELNIIFKPTPVILRREADFPNANILHTAIQALQT